jgi:hypothetical protein
VSLIFNLFLSTFIFQTLASLVFNITDPYHKLWSTTDLPDGLFSNQKSKFGKILDGLGIEKGWYIL